MFPEELSTERLRLERCCRENVSVREFYDACSHRNPDIEEVTQYLSWDPHESVKESRDTLAHFEQAWEDGDIATYLIIPREGEDGAGELAGTCGLTCKWDRDCAVLGVWLHKRFWERGYSGERADRMIRMAFEDLDFGMVAVSHQAGNEPSERAIRKYVERNGGRREGLLRNNAADEDGPVDRVRYTISREEWRAADDQS